MRICYKSVTKIDLDKLPSNPDGSLNVASLPPESSVLHIEFELDGSLMHIIYSMEDESPEPTIELGSLDDIEPYDNTIIQDDEKITILDWKGDVVRVFLNTEKGGIPNIWKQQQDLKQPD